MRIKLLQGYNGLPAGRELTLGDGVAQLLIQRKIAESIEAAPSDHDPDGDGTDEGAEDGTKKAFSKPPSHKRHKK